MLSAINGSNNAKFLDSVGSTSNVSKSDSSSICAAGSNSFGRVLQTKTQNSENSKDTDATSKSIKGSESTSRDVNGKEQTNINQQTTVKNDTSSKTNEEKLQDIEKQINDINNGTESVSNNDLEAIIASLQQILSSILKKASATQSDKSSSGNLDTNLVSKLTELKIDLANHGKFLSSSKNDSGKQVLSDLISKLGMEKTDLNNGAAGMQNVTTENNTVVSNTALSNGVSSNVAGSNTDDNGLLSKIKKELTTLIKDIKSSESTSSQLVSSSKLNYIEQLLTVTNKAINTVKLPDIPLIDASKLNNVMQEDFSTTLSSSLSSDSSESSSDNTYGNNMADKDTNFLNKLIDNKDSSSDKYQKVTSVINQLLSNNVSSSSDIKTPATVVRSSNFSEDIIKSLTYMDNNNIKDMTVTIAPKGLGTVMINITTENGVMKASITATNKEAYNLLNANADQINSSLKSQEIKIGNVNINIYNGDTTFFKDGSNPQDSGNQNHNNSKTTNVIGGIDDGQTEDQSGIYENDNVNALV